MRYFKKQNATLNFFFFFFLPRIRFQDVDKIQAPLWSNHAVTILHTSQITQVTGEGMGAYRWCAWSLPSGFPYSINYFP